MLLAPLTARSAPRGAWVEHHIAVSTLNQQWNLLAILAIDTDTLTRAHRFSQIGGRYLSPRASF